LAADIVNARGHPNVRARHPTTMEITKEDTLTPRGDCVIGVAADKAAADLSPELLSELAKGYSLAAAILVGGLIDVFFAEGSPGHIPTSSTSIVIRRSSYLDERTLGIRATKSARGLDRQIVNLLKKPETEMKIVFVTAPNRREALIALAAQL